MLAGRIGWWLSGSKAKVALWPRSSASTSEIDATLPAFKTRTGRPVWSEQIREPDVAGRPNAGVQRCAHARVRARAGATHASTTTVHPLTMTTDRSPSLCRHRAFKGRYGMPCCGSSARNEHRPRPGRDIHFPDLVAPRLPVGPAHGCPENAPRRRTSAGVSSPPMPSPRDHARVIRGFIHLRKQR